MPFPLRHPVVLLGACLVAATGLRAIETPNYETQIRPILKEHCTHCHGEEEKLKGGIDLRLRRFMDGKTEDGNPVLTPGHPEKSALFTLTRDGSLILCGWHGAVFEPLSGACVGGPCAGARLTPWPVVASGGIIRTA